MSARIGLDVGATKTLGVVVGPDGRVLARRRRPTRPGAAGLVDTVAAVVTDLDPDGAVAHTVGVGVPGLVDVAEGSVKHAVNLGLDGAWVPLGGLLAERLGRPVVLENDVNAAALGAAAVLGQDDLAYLSIGTGLAAGLVLDGALRRGAHGAAGEIGHVPVDPEGRPCGCGQRGCLETVASGSALERLWPTDAGPPAQVLFAAADAGDVKAVAGVERFADAVAAAVRLLGLATDASTYVLGGGVAHVGEPLRIAVAEALRRQAARSAFLGSLDLAGRLALVPADHAVSAVGAAMMAAPAPRG